MGPGEGRRENEQRFVVGVSVVLTLHGRQIEDCLDDGLEMPCRDPRDDRPAGWRPDPMRSHVGARPDGVQNTRGPAWGRGEAVARNGKDARTRGRTGVRTILEYRRESRPKAYRLCIPPDERRARERRARDPRWGLGARVLPLQP